MLIIIFLGLSLLLYLAWRLYQLELMLKEQMAQQAQLLSHQIKQELDLAGQRQLLDNQERGNQLQAQLYSQMTDLREVLHQNMADNRDRVDGRLDVISQTLYRSVKDMQTSNEERLEQMRQTVEEKLEETLQNRLQTSFESVSRQLETVNQGLGQMQNLAQDVGNLNKVLSNNKTRGIMGEIQLGQIIEDLLSPSQYEREFATVPSSRERVEYAIKLPGKASKEPIYLPVDAKFPLEAYYRLEDAYELGNKEAIQASRKELLAAMTGFAKDIEKKYLAPPATTDFAIMFLPTEGLYAEAVRQPAFFDDLRRKHHIIIAGPSTLSALLNSLSVGFRTLSIQQNADDIGKVLGNVKLEFGKFAGLLSKAQKQLQTANNTLDSLVSTRTNAIIKALDKVEDYQAQATQSLLELPQLEEEKYEN